MASPAHSPSVIRFGAFELDTAHGTLRKAGISVKLHPQPFRVLSLLAECPGQIVTREQIQHCLWGDNTFVDFEGGINFCVKQIRAALGDDPEKPRYIETLHRRGYRFIAPAHVAARATESAESRAELRIVSEDETAPPEAIADHAPQVGAQPLQISGTKASVVMRPWLMALTVCVVLVFVAALARPVVPPPRLTGVRQITHIGTAIWNESLLVNGSRIYFASQEHGENQIRYVSLDDGAISSVEKPFQKIELADIAPSGSELLVAELSQSASFPAWTRTLWRLPIPTGAQQRVGSVFADDASWSPDGRSIVYTNEPDQSLSLVDGDGGNPRKLASLPGIPFKPRWSPDGRFIRTSALDSQEGGIALWQVDVSGRTVRRMLTDWSSSSRAWTGSWTRDGRYFFFIGSRGATDARAIWALREQRDLFRRNRTDPVQLTDGPLNFYQVVPSSDSKTIYAIGSQRHGQLMRYNERSGEFEPYANGLSIDQVSFSRDGKWMAYSTYPEGALVRSRVDGSDRLQLTFAPIHGFNPTWSPDGSQVAFMTSAHPGGPSKIYLVSANGGSPRLAIPGGNEIQGRPTWSLDGQSFVFATSDESGSHWELHSFDLKTEKEIVLPGTRGIQDSMLSPDGRYLACVSASWESLVLYDIAAGTTRKLADVGNYPSWSSDGKYVYYSTLAWSGPLGSDKAAVYRVKIADGSIERVVSKPSFPLAGNWGYWSGLTPDGSTLLLRELGTSDIYALDANLP
jgi:Tol biopolymer transport system component/DNA-binding winged helix-turn-helix (wHTH) protein